HAETDSEHWRAALGGLPDRIDQLLLPQTCHAVAESADTREQYGACGSDIFGRGKNMRRRPYLLQGLQHRRQITDLHIDDYDIACHTRTGCGSCRDIGTNSRRTSPFFSNCLT